MVASEPRPVGGALTETDCFKRGRDDLVVLG